MFDEAIPEDNPIETILPNFQKKFANLHYQSELTGEIGCIEVRPNTTEENLLDQYQKKFPKECASHLQTIQDIGRSLYNQNGMSKERRIMSLTKIPEILYTAFKFIDEDFWNNKKNVYRFLRKFPKLSIGDHSLKTTRGIISK